MKKESFKLKKIASVFLLSFATLEVFAEINEITASIDVVNEVLHDQINASESGAVTNHNLGVSQKSLQSNENIPSTQPLSSTEDIKLGEYIIPSMFARTLKEGLNLSVYLRYKDGDQNERQKIANALIVLENNNLVIKDVTFVENTNGASLSEQTINLLNEIKNQSFIDNNTIRISNGSELNLNIKSFILTLDVDKESLSASNILRSETLGKSSVNSLSSVLNYDLGFYHLNQKNRNNNTNSYLHLESTIGQAENHLNLKGSAYGLGDSDKRRTDFYRAMFERDVNGHRFAMGMVDTWSLQSIANMSALNTSRVYGVSYGNHSASEVTDGNFSLTPITVFLPKAGEVHVLRDGRLINIQNFQMGSYELDTRLLPYGIYDVEVEVFIDGNSSSKSVHKVNKNFSGKNAQINKLNWQVYGGYVDYKNKQNQNAITNQKNTNLMGFSTAITFPILSGLTIQSSNYTFDHYFINESAFNLGLNQYTDINWQWLVNQKGGNRNIFTLNLRDSKGFGSLWGNIEKGNFEESFSINDSDALSFGGSINLDRIIDKTGMLTFSRTDDKQAKSELNNIEYYNTLYSGQQFNLNLRAGIQQHHYNNSKKNQKNMFL